MAQIRISGNSFGNKGCSVILSFRKYPRKYAYPGQKVALAPGEISGQGGRKVHKNLFGEEQMTALADYLQTSLMLNYNKRTVG